MGTVREKITPAIAEFIAAQPIFFVATAPSGDGGHVNLSPKGLDTFAVLDERPPATRAGIASSSDVGARPLADHGKRPLRTTKSSSATHPGRRLVWRHSTRRVCAATFGLTTADSLERFEAKAHSPRAGFAGPDLTRCGRCRVGGTSRGGLAPFVHAEKNAVSIDGLPALP